MPEPEIKNYRYIRILFELEIKRLLK